MATAAAIAAWEAEGLRLLRTAAEDDARAKLRASAERVSLAARGPRSRPAFERVASLSCEFLDTTALCALSACSSSMTRVAREDHLWRALTVRTYPEALDLRGVGGSPHVSGYREFLRITALWKLPRSKQARAPGIDAYCLLLVFKIDGRRIAGGLFDMSVDNDETSDTTVLYVDLPGIMRLPEFAAPFSEALDSLTVSICVLRRIDGKCLRLMTDVRNYSRDSEEITFDGSRRPQNAVMFDYYRSKNRALGHAYPDFYLLGHDTADTAPPAHLRLWDDTFGAFLSKEAILGAWHESYKWT